MRKHSNVCPDCGAWLDPGETCDCEDDLQEERRTTRERLKEIQAAEIRNRNRISQHVSNYAKHRNMLEHLYK